MSPARMYYDTHCHIDAKQFDADRDAVLARMREYEVFANVIGVDAASSRTAVELAQKHNNLSAVVGQHPLDNPHESFDASVYEALLAEGIVVGIGECGLDYFRIDSNDANEKHRQHELFAAQIALAQAHDLPLVLHCRPGAGSMDAYEDTLAMLEAGEPGVRGVVHFFVGDARIAERFVALGFFISFSGVVTFAREYDEAVRSVPADRLLAETDAPYAAPEPFRGRRNEPVYVIETTRALADIRGVEHDALRAQLFANAKSAFHLN